MTVSIVEVDKLDRMGASEDGESLMLYIFDHLDWKEEAGHLYVLQDKINTYIEFLESGQWKDYVPKEATFKYATIEVCFKYDITKNCEKFLQAVQDQVGQLGIKIRGVVTG